MLPTLVIGLVSVQKLTRDVPSYLNQKDVPICFDETIFFFKKGTKKKKEEAPFRLLCHLGSIINSLEQLLPFF